MPLWPGVAEQSFDAVISINMIHIAAWEACRGLGGLPGPGRPAGAWEACRGLMAGAARVLRRDGLLLLRSWSTAATSRAAFDASLKAMDPQFGVRDVGAVSQEAALRGLALKTQVQMPANNLVLVLQP
jgi:Protein of unknown function (DUF938)